MVGSVIISRFVNERIWRLKCVESQDCDGDYYFLVGLVSTQTDHTKTERPLSLFGYGYDAFDGDVSPAGHYDAAVDEIRVPKVGDILSIKYETIEESSGNVHGKMMFYINDKQIKAYFNNIKISNGETYRFGVSFHGAGDTIQLLH